MDVFEIVNKKRYLPIALALTASLLYGFSAPLSKLLLGTIAPMFMVALLYCGAGAGMFMLRLFSGVDRKERSLSRRELPAVIAMVLLDVAAPFLLMKGLQGCAASNASLLNNFEMVATSLVAMLFFREKVTRRTWTAIALVTFASILLSVDFHDATALMFTHSSLLILGACVCWGIENNCTRVLSVASPLEIVVVKGFGSGLTAFALAWLNREAVPSLLYAVYALLLGFVAYGLSIYFYVLAQRRLGAARTSTYYATAPFIGVLLSMAILKELPGWNFWLAFGIMLSGMYVTSREK